MSLLSQIIVLFLNGVFGEKVLDVLGWRQMEILQIGFQMAKLAVHCELILNIILELNLVNGKVVIQFHALKTDNIIY